MPQLLLGMMFYKKTVSRLTGTYSLFHLAIIAKVINKSFIGADVWLLINLLFHIYLFFFLLLIAICTMKTFERMRSLGICQSRANYLKTMDAIGKHSFTTVFLKS